MIRIYFLTFGSYPHSSSRPVSRPRAGKISKINSFRRNKRERNHCKNHQKRDHEVVDGETRGRGKNSFSFESSGHHRQETAGNLFEALILVINDGNVHVVLARAPQRRDGCRVKSFFVIGAKKEREFFVWVVRVGKSKSNGFQ